MEVEQQFNYGHLLLYDRQCRSCGEIKNLIDGFYRIRKSRGPSASSFSYECKECTIKRIKKSRKNIQKKTEWEYPDW